MARSKRPEAEKLNGEAVTASAAAAAGALRMAAETARGMDRRLETSHLTELCNIAADHLAMAHKSLFGGPEDAERAIGHLDAALNCLKQLDAETMRAVQSPVIRRRAGN